MALVSHLLTIVVTEEAILVGSAITSASVSMSALDEQDGRSCLSVLSVCVVSGHSQ